MFKKIFISIILICLFVLTTLFGASYYNVIKKKKARQMASATAQSEVDETSSKTYFANFVRLSDGSGYLHRDLVETELPQEYKRHLLWPEGKVVKVAMQIVRKTDLEKELYKYIEKAIERHGEQLKKLTGNDYIYIPEPVTISSCDFYGYLNKTDILIYYQSFSTLQPRCKRNYEDGVAMVDGKSFAEMYTFATSRESHVYIDRKTRKKNGVCDFPKGVFHDVNGEGNKQEKIDDIVISCILSVSGIKDVGAKHQ